MISLSVTTQIVRKKFSRNNLIIRGAYLKIELNTSLPSIFKKSEDVYNLDINAVYQFHGVVIYFLCTNSPAFFNAAAITWSMS